MTKFFVGEQWREFFPECKLKLRYAISNFGRVMSFKNTIMEGRILKPGIVDGYKLFRWKIGVNGKILNKNLFIRKLVAENFLQKTSPDQTFVIFLDRNRSNNHISNLQWVTRNEMLEHMRTSPYFIAARYNKKSRYKGHKLTSTKVILLKKKLFDPNRKTRMKMLAKQFGISEMQLHRIKTGENWGHIKI